MMATALAYNGVTASERMLQIPLTFLCMRYFFSFSIIITSIVFFILGFFNLVREQLVVGEVVKVFAI